MVQSLGECKPLKSVTNLLTIREKSYSNYYMFQHRLFFLIVKKVLFRNQSLLKAVSYITRLKYVKR